MNAKVGGAFIVLVVLGGVLQCSGTATTPAPTPAKSTSTGTSADASAELACGHFRNVVSDINDGLLTPGEVRVKIQEVYDTASVSENAGIADGARSMLAAATADNGPEFLLAMNGFADSCRAAGV